MIFITSPIRRGIHQAAAAVLSGTPPKAIPGTPKHVDPAAEQRSPTAASHPSEPLPKQAKKTPKRDGEVQQSLSALFPSIAAGWMSASNSKLVRPSHLAPSSVKLIWWRCPSCTHTFRKRVYHHVADRGECPSCHKRPTATAVGKFQKRTAAGANEVVMPIRSDAQSLTPGAKRAGNVHPSVGDKNREMIEERNLQPMLAQSYDKYAHLLPEGTIVAASPKLDGIRCVVAMSKTGQILYFSRNGALFECCDHLNDAAARLFKRDRQLVLDCELYNHKLFREDFSLLNTAVRTTRSKRTAEVIELQQKLELHCFDVMHSGVLPPDADYQERYNYLGSLLGDPVAGGSPSIIRSTSSTSSSSGAPANMMHHHADLVRSSSSSSSPRGAKKSSDSSPPRDASLGQIQLVPARLIDCADLPAYFSEARAERYEGIMVKLLKEPYAHGKRSTALLKFKQMQDAEYEIAGAVKGSGKWENSLGAFVCKTPSGQLFSVSPSVNEAMRLELWKQRHALIGRVLTVQFQELSPKGIPRFPIGKSVRGNRDGTDWV